MTAATTVTLRVPGTTANLGPGYDVLGLALNIWMKVTVSVADAFGMTMSGFGSDEVAQDDTNFLVASCQLAFEHCGVALPKLHYTVHNDIPFGCGVGSSSAAATAGYMAGLVLCGKTLQSVGQEALLDRIVALEGHPDNAAPAIYGGMQIGYKVGDGFKTARVPLPANLYCVLFHPKEKLKASTHATRGLVPSELSIADAVHNMSRTAIITLAMSTNQLHLLANCCDDRIHEPPRIKKLFPFVPAVIQAAQANGACYSFLSGAGPTVCAFVPGKTTDIFCQDPKERTALAVAEAMKATAEAAGVHGFVTIATTSEQGAHVVGRNPVADGIFSSA